MLFVETPLTGCFVLEIEPRRDQRGFFARSFCTDEMTANGLHADFVQSNVSVNDFRGTLRGLHLQKAPYGEVKLVRCTRGAVFDVVVDLRKNSPGFGQWTSVELTESNHKTLYIPEGFAHGFQVLENDTELFYMMSQAYVPGFEAGVRWDDPQLAIPWPLTDGHRLSERDAGLPLLSEL